MRMFRAEPLQSEGCLHHQPLSLRETLSSGSRTEKQTVSLQQQGPTHCFSKESEKTKQRPVVKTDRALEVSFSLKIFGWPSRSFAFFSPKAALLMR